MKSLESERAEPTAALNKQMLLGPEHPRSVTSSPLKFTHVLPRPWKHLVGPPSSPS